MQTSVCINKQCVWVPKGLAPSQPFFALSKDEKRKGPKRTVTKEASLLNDDTDIFSDVPASTTRESKRKGGPKKAAAEKKGVFKDDVGELRKK